MNLQEYIDSLNSRFKLGNATEHSFRGDLQQLIETIVPEIKATNEPKRQTCGAPDYIITKKDIPVGFIEAKDIGDKDLEGLKKTGNKEQFDRYKASLNNLIFTDYLRFYLYHDGELVTKIDIAEITDKDIKAKTENFTRFENILKDFCTHVGQTIKSPKKLAEMMAGKARLLANIIERALTIDEEKQENSSLKDQLMAFRQILIHDITPKGFADVYAQTIAYGLFAARLHDTSLNDFSRQEACELIPKSNPFLRKLFGYISGPDIDDRIKWIVDSLAEIFLATNVEEILENYGKSTKMEDPIIHFYETFLSEYDPKLRKARGVWYTPLPVVNFIVRAVDDILKTEFDLPQGLADTSKTKIDVDMQGKKVKQEVHKVQILDPATGTGTFLAEVIRHIYKKFQGQQGIWSKYVNANLLPRLNGFELLMASYAMAHLKLELLLKETGYNSDNNQRLKIFLTNSLEQASKEVPNLFMAQWLTEEAIKADFVKRDTPVMCVIGNPPYAISSTNKGDWIQNLLIEYKKDLNERKINIDDDYIKFIRYGQHYIQKSGEGILAYISSNSFLDGVTHRQMRKNLLETFDKIYIIDLHGNAKKKELTPEGKADQNVFDIMTGVSINIFIKSKKGKSKRLGKVFHIDAYGSRENKYDFLVNNNFHSIDWDIINYQEPYFFFVPKNLSKEVNYEKGINLESLFVNKNTGIQTKNDSLTLCYTKDDLKNLEDDFLNLEIDELKIKYGIKEGTWKIENAKKDLITGNYTHIKILVKAFDVRFTLLNQVSSGFLGRPRYDTMKHMIPNDNLALLVSRQNKSNTIDSFFITNVCSEMKSAERTIQSYHLPLYVYSEFKSQQTIKPNKRIPNFNSEILNQITKKLDLRFTEEKESNNKTFSPIDILDYIYAILYSPSYR